MKKRHLCRICVWVILWLSVNGILKGSGAELPPLPASAGEQLYLQGTVYRMEKRESGLSLYLKNISIFSEPAKNLPENSEWNEKCAIVYTGEDPDVRIGNEILAKGICAYPKEQRNPGGFDAKKYYGAQSIAIFLQKADIIERTDCVWPVRDSIRKIGNILERQLYLIGNENDAGILNAMLLGNRNGVGEEIKDLYQDVGIIHLLAISGLHVSMTGMALYRALRRLCLPFGAAGFLAGGIMTAYACMTGFGISTVRAVLMFVIFLISQCAGRTYDLLTSLTVAAVVLLGFRDANITQAAFLLSFGAVCGVIHSRGWKSGRLLETPLGIGISVQIWTLPLGAYFYYQIPVYAVLLNLLVIPLMPFVLIFGIAGIAASFLSTVLGQFFFAPAHYLLWLTKLLCLGIRRLPGAFLVTGQPALWKLAIYYGAVVIFGIFFRKYQKYQKIDLIKLIFAIILLAGVFLPSGQKEFTMTFLDVGQGDGCCVQNEGRSVWMVDGGSSNEKNIARYGLEPFLKYSGTDTVDYWMVSHFDSDHISGLLEILASYVPGAFGKNIAGITIGTILVPRGLENTLEAANIISLAAKNGIRVRTVGRGDTLHDGNMTVKILAPEDGAFYDNNNEASVVALVTYHGFSALLTGDVEGEGERRLLKEGLLADIDLLKAAHHGSAYTTSKEFLEETLPEVTVISCGEHNSYGHPHKELLERLKMVGSAVFRTDFEGAIRILVSKNGDYRIFR
ncbi:MAG: DNA internalization-related competence protein ComEC/Rec2 [Eubacteriales bacterium]|nr:DNA internalization-related competence protein ComEC/Rec2 [Eubacteriales bacterium]